MDTISYKKCIELLHDVSSNVSVIQMGSAGLTIIGPAQPPAAEDELFGFGVPKVVPAVVTPGLSGPANEIYVPSPLPICGVV